MKGLLIRKTNDYETSFLQRLSGRDSPQSPGSAYKNQYGEDRLIYFCNEQSPDTPSEEFVEKLTQSMKAFTKDNDQNDDITIMSVRV